MINLEKKKRKYGRGISIPLPVGTFVKESERMVRMVTNKHTTPVYLAVPIFPEKLANRVDLIIDKAIHDLVPWNVSHFTNPDGTIQEDNIKQTMKRLINIYLKANKIIQ